MRKNPLLDATATTHPNRELKHTATQTPKLLFQQPRSNWALETHLVHLDGFTETRSGWHRSFELATLPSNAPWIRPTCPWHATDVAMAQMSDYLATATLERENVALKAIHSHKNDGSIMTSSEIRRLFLLRMNTVHPEIGNLFVWVWEWCEFRSCFGFKVSQPWRISRRPRFRTMGFWVETLVRSLCSLCRGCAGWRSWWGSRLCRLIMGWTSSPIPLLQFDVLWYSAPDSCQFCLCVYVLMYWFMGWWFCVFLSGNESIYIMREGLEEMCCWSVEAVGDFCCWRFCSFVFV